jgi:RNA polymerase sigma-70 factor, ECF subfamily
MLSQTDNHAALIVACAKGERAALQTIYQRESAAMIGIAARIVKRRELAEEVVHDAFVQVWRHAASFDPSIGNGRAWLYAIVRNRAINLLRDTSREQAAPEEEITALMESGTAAEDAFDRLAEGSALRRCLQQLDPKRRLGVLLAYVEGLSHGEIAAKLGVPLGTAKAWLRRSLIALKDCLA